MPCMSPVGCEDGLTCAIHVVRIGTAVDVDIDESKRNELRVDHPQVRCRVIFADMGDPPISASDKSPLQHTIWKDQVP